ncbi:hypothetical protein [Kordiimonas laminariae]|uniref:hypothetical protein n=1 Tax=Kordiimonas laminariae TaxID=2917717 RepID=UPI001FF2E57E|nr:hypothetical protein [Kordiimonas laminariae]MCK0069261.1 hypothetical protein [Kordiimonas laminariae]
MLKNIALIIMGLTSLEAVADDQTVNQRDPAKLAQFMNNLSGQWNCEGGTAGGTKTAATIEFKGKHNNQVYTFTQVGTKGHTNTLESVWAYDAPNQNLIVSRRYMSPTGVSTDMFEAESWDATTLLLNARELWSPLFAEHRFLFQINSSEKLEVTWEVKRGENGYKMGDYLSCKKSDT